MVTLFQNSALHDASSFNAARCVPFLLTMGAKIVHNKAGARPLDIATSNKFDDVVKAMIEHERWEEILMQPSQIYGWPCHGLIKELPEIMWVSQSVLSIYSL